MELNQDTIILMVAIAAASFVITSMVLVVMANMGWINVAEGMPFVNSDENELRVVQVYDFKGLFVTDVKLSPRGSFLLEAKNNMNNTVELSEITLNNRYDGAICKCSALPEIVHGRQATQISCNGCVGREHLIGEEFKVQVDMREYYPETGILRTDTGIIKGFYRT